MNLNEHAIASGNRKRKPIQNSIERKNSHFEISKSHLLTFLLHLPSEEIKKEERKEMKREMRVRMARNHKKWTENNGGRKKKRDRGAI